LLIAATAFFRLRIAPSDLSKSSPTQLKYNHSRELHEYTKIQNHTSINSTFEKSVKVNCAILKIRNESEKAEIPLKGLLFCIKMVVRVEV